MTFPALRSILLLLFIALLLSSCGGSIGSFGPLLPSTENPLLVAGVPQRISFVELNDAPSAYEGRFLRVVGRLSILEPTLCPGHKGPAPRWALIADALQLDAVGYDNIIPTLDEQTLMTVDGYWRLYRGPLGCGKDPATAVAWYLQVVHIVDPNPLPLVNVPSLLTGPTELTPTPTRDLLLSPTPTIPTVGGTPFPTPSPTLFALPTSTPTPALFASPTATSAFLPSPTPTPSPTNTPRGTAVATPTSPPGASATPTVPPTETKAVTPTPTNVPGTPLPTQEATNTPAGYPAPTDTPDAYPWRHRL